MSAVAGLESGRYLRPAMDIKEIKELYSAAPFRPFEMVLTNGTTVYVSHPEFMMFSPGYKTVYAADVHSGDTKRLDVKMIVALTNSQTAPAHASASGDPSITKTDL